MEPTRSGPACSTRFLKNVLGFWVFVLRFLRHKQGFVDSSYKIFSMLIGFRTGNRYRPACGGFLLAFVALLDPRLSHFQDLTLEMETQMPAKRPFCASCSKPARLCICSRFKTPSFDNTIHVTILQHSQEKNHPLNSTRIATLGLKNLTVAAVSDIHIDTQFLVRLLKPDFGTDSAAIEAKNSQKTIFGHSLRNGCVFSATHLESSQQNEKKSDLEQIQVQATKKRASKVTDVECSNADDRSDRENGENCFGSIDIAQMPLISEVEHGATSNGTKDKRSNFVSISDSPTEEEGVSDMLTVRAHENRAVKPDFRRVRANPSEEECLISATMTKCGSTFSLTHLQSTQNYSGKPDFEQLLASQVGKDAVSSGFVVRKLQKKQMGESAEFRECEEFEIVVPPGSALLFPTKKAIGIENVDFKVNNLIVLDGTWQKAKRMYHENPWLKLLPHLKLDPDRMSLYGEVRHQPKAGCLSTIESIVYALKAFEGNSQALDDLLDVFESMIGDQRRCKDEKFSKICPK